MAAELCALLAPVERIIARAAAMSEAAAEPVPEPYATYALDIADAAHHLRTLLGELGAATVEQDMGHEADDVELLRLARRMAGMLSVEASRRGIVIEFAGDRACLHRAAFDLTSVRQILLNLIGNAVRYAPDGSSVTVAVTSGNGRVALTVADEGPGLLSGEQALVFDKFERLGRSDDGGSGLGLYISRGLARRMGGELSVESVRGLGSRFTLELPGS